jgi:hypothetical protein
VVDDKDINAFSLPGGYIYVFQGLVEFCQSDDELAGVLSHEIMHAQQRHVHHIRREQEKLAPIQIPLILATIFSGDGTGAAAGSLLGTAVTNGWGQKAEFSADLAGAQLMIAAGYNATGLITFMERLQMQQGALSRINDDGIFRTHPPSRARADMIEGYLRSEKIPISRSAVAHSFRVQAGADDEGIAIFFGQKKLLNLSEASTVDRLNIATTSINRFLDSVPDMFEVKVGPDGHIYGRDQLLILLTERDAEANGTTLAKLQEITQRNIRACIFSLAWHIWEGRRG